MLNIIKLRSIQVPPLPLQLQLTRSISQGKKTYYEKKFNLQEREKILRVLNESCSSEDLVNYKINTSRVKDIFKWRNEYSGEFKTLDDLLPGFDRMALSKFYYSIVGKTPGESNKEKVTSTPSIPQSISKGSKRIVSAVFTGNFLSWVLIEKDESGYLNIQSLEQREFVPTSGAGNKSILLATLDQIKEVIHEIPKCDVCIVEENVLSKPNFNSLTLQNCQSKSMFLAYLAAQPNAPNILTFKPTVVARTFKTLIGNEKVSGQLVIQDFVRAKNPLQMTMKLKNEYESYPPVTREYISDAILLNIAYWVYTKQLNHPYAIEEPDSDSNSADNKS